MHCTLQGFIARLVEFLKYALMHLVAHPFATHWGGSTCRSLELSCPIKQPYSTEDQEWGLYFKYDANLSTSAKSMTGIVGMLAGGRDRQHLPKPAVQGRGTPHH